MNKTLLYYHEKSSEFFDSTVNADVSSLYGRFLKYVPMGSKILDFGCGSGRDTKAFLNMGFDVDAIDGSKKLCEMSTEYTGIDVQCQDFMSLECINEYDAIWACASLLHLPSVNLPIVLAKMKDALKTSGIMYLSFKLGTYEGERGGRYYTDMDSERFRTLIDSIPEICVLEEWCSDDVRMDNNGKWYNVILEKQRR